MAELDLSLFGAIQVTTNKKSIIKFRSVNVQGLLVYLVLQAERPFSRQHLATLFWPDESESIAKKNLRQTLYQLRKLLGDHANRKAPFFHITHQSIQFNLDSDYAIDVKRFLNAVDIGDLKTAVSLYSADLLTGLKSESLEFEAWLNHERDRLRGVAMEAMAMLGARYLGNGRLEAAQTVARHQLSFEPWSEIAHQQLIEGLALAGNRTAALAQFELCQEILADELGVSPTDETFKLIAKIEKGELQPLDPTRIAGRYTLDHEIGRGATGIVYRGRDSISGETVAIKVLDDTKVAQQPELVPRFLREGEALQRLDHPNIVKMRTLVEEHDANDGLRAGSYCLVMDYVPGGDLQSLLHQQKLLPIKQALTIALDLADALTRSHRLHILHRDIKPANVLLDESGRPLLTDFGIARLGQTSELTEPDAIVGTLAYLSPEACRGERLDDRSDIWSFGVLLYEMLMGERPFVGNNPANTITQILHNPIPDFRLRRLELPESLEDLLYRMLAKNRADRIPSIRLVGVEIEGILRETPIMKDALGSNQSPVALEPRAVFALSTPSSQRARHNLPIQTTPFIGREFELTELSRLLEDRKTRLITIVGSGGMGKTRLMSEVGRQLVDNASLVFPDGVFFIELATVTSIYKMTMLIASVFGLERDEHLEPLDQIINFISNKQLLLLLDNFEQLLNRDVNGAEAILKILQAAPSVKIMVSSRQKLYLSSEVVFGLEGLAIPDFQMEEDALTYSAVQLFVQSAQRVRYDFTLSETSLNQIVQICRLTEGIPLGIVLAATWINMLSLDEIADEIKQDIDFLASELKDLPSRQRSMRAVFDYSWALLTEKEQAILARLAIFRGGFTREAAQAVSGTSLRQLLEIVNKSLVQRNVENGRFSLHELLRQLADEKLALLETRESTLASHAQYYLMAAVKFESEFKGKNQKNAINKVETEKENILAGWRWAAIQNNASLLHSALSAIHITVSLQDKIRAYKFALEKLQPQSDTNYLRDCILNRLYISDVSNPEITPSETNRLLKLFKTNKDNKEYEITLGIICNQLFRSGKYSEAVKVTQNRLDVVRVLNDPFVFASQLIDFGFDLMFTGQYTAAQENIYEGLQLARTIGHKLGVEQATILLAGFSIMIVGDYKKGAAYLDEAIKIRQDLGISTLFGAKAIWVTQPILEGQFEEAERRSQIVVKEAFYLNLNKDRAYFSHGCLLMLREDYEEAGKFLNDVVKISKHPTILHLTHFCLAYVDYSKGSQRQAIDEILQSLKFIPMKPKVPATFIWYIPLIATILADNSQTKQAIEVMAMASVHPACPTRWWENWAFVQNLEKRLKNLLPLNEYFAARNRGLEMDVEQTAVSLLEYLKELKP